MKSGPLTIERNTNGASGIETVRLTGPLTLATLAGFQQAVTEHPKPRTIVDLSGVPYIDSAGLGSILSFHAACQRSGRLYALSGLSPRVQTMFAASKTDRLVHLFPNAIEAERSLAQ